MYSTSSVNVCGSRKHVLSKIAVDALQLCRAEIILYLVVYCFVITSIHFNSMKACLNNYCRSAVVSIEILFEILTLTLWIKFLHKVRTLSRDESGEVVTLAF